VLRRLVIAGILNAAALWAADELLDGVRIDGWEPLLIAAAVLAVVSSLVKPVLVVLSIPLILLTLGLFLLVINAALLALTDWVVDGFDVAGWWSYLGAVVIVWLVNALLGRLID